MHGILRVAAAVPHVFLGNVDKNVQAHLEKIQEAKERNAALVVFPELSLTGATCGDLFRQHSLQDAVIRGLAAIAENMPEGITAVVGAPICVRSGLYDCAVVISEGVVRGVVPKTCLDADARWFRSGAELEEELWLDQYGFDFDAMLGTEQIFTSLDGVTFGIEVGSDLTAPLAPSTLLALGGADVVVNLAAVGEKVGRRDTLRQTILQQSAR